MFQIFTLSAPREEYTIGFLTHYLSQQKSKSETSINENRWLPGKGTRSPPKRVYEDHKKRHRVNPENGIIIWSSGRVSLGQLRKSQPRKSQPGKNPEGGRTLKGRTLKGRTLMGRMLKGPTLTGLTLKEPTLTGLTLKGPTLTWLTFEGGIVVTT
jgi:hypothetical protein